MSEKPKRAGRGICNYKRWVHSSTPVDSVLGKSGKIWGRDGYGRLRRVAKTGGLEAGAGGNRMRAAHWKCG